MAEPIRQCVACRQRKTKKELFRIVRTRDGRVEFDPEQRKAGRGLYVCKTVSCVQRAKTNDLLNQTYHVKIPTALYSQLAACIHHNSKNSLERDSCQLKFKFFQNC